MLRTATIRSGPRLARALSKKHVPVIGRFFETTSTVQAAFGGEGQIVHPRTPGKVSKTLRVLDMDIVDKISEELKAVDHNSDGRYVYLRVVLAIKGGNCHSFPILYQSK